MLDSSFNISDLDELISQKLITYNTKYNKYNLETNYRNQKKNITIII